ncbi:glycosyltransferase involved in cell wall biosynthesis [Chitinophaga terrae (ex Kim and Jung 2007)]|uniref:glycosyltransferase n=1 Tax=Chitinophaga terrae (ex Kim and Jung 2007) TaxID=408074 RepID=UPI002781B954|nr:glycosyltransferase [Chitinophaga terrae (ex Kim and Jung 2007)]MDQ0107384.1 glycosyltransferase involved in cell wall biosynthesis [Chitinophaga terrae (ex Kim and Jung 2007)]
MTKVLFTFPLNPIEKTSGAQTRVITLLKYFKERGMEVDFFSLTDYWGVTSDENIKAFRESGQVRNAWFYPRKPAKKNFFQYLFSYKLPKLLHNVKGAIPNHVSPYLQEKFNKILEQHQYDFIIVSYAYWADLIKDNPRTGNAVTIADTHDLLSAQHQHDKGVNRGIALGDELKRLSRFDQVWLCSPEENYFFSQFLKNQVKYIPTMVEEPADIKRDVPKKYDMIYVASHNPHNLAAADWFFKQVFPLIPEHVNLCVVGSISRFIPGTYKNVTLVPFAEDLSEYYLQSKVVICPMLSGTGVKIKVVEAMLYGLPVVCNERGMDGLPDKSNCGCLVTQDPKEFAGYILKLLEDKAFHAQQSELSAASFRNNFAAANVYKKLDKALNYSPKH